MVLIEQKEILNRYGIRLAGTGLNKKLTTLLQY